MWKCESMRPGITVRPERSIVSAPAGTPIVAAGPTRTMRSPSMTMRPFSIGAAPLPSMMRTLSRTTGRVCAVSAAATHSAIARRRRRSSIEAIGACSSPSRAVTRTPGPRIARSSNRDAACASRPLAALPRGAAHAEQRPRGAEPAASQPVGEPAVPVEGVHDDRPAVRRAERRAHERSARSRRPPRPRDRSDRRGARDVRNSNARRRPFRSRARTAAAPSSAHSRRIRRWAPKTRSSRAITAGRSAAVRRTHMPRRDAVECRSTVRASTARPHDASASTSSSKPYR